MLNPFEVHSNYMEQYNDLLDTPISSAQGNQRGNVEGDYVIYGGSKIKATVGAFEIRQVILPAGGISPRLVGEAIIQKKLMPFTINFQTGQKLTVFQVGGNKRSCQISGIGDTYLEWRLELWDQSQNV